jgi:hypothetical protein
VTTILAIPIVFAGATLAAYGISKLIIEIADLLHLVYSAEREARREARIEAEYAQRHPPLPAGAYRPSPYYVPTAGPIMRRVLQHNLRKVGP